MEEDDGETEKPSRWAKVGKFMGSPRCKLYVSYALSTWSDRSWSFAVSLALYEVTSTLLLPAVSNVANSAAVILFGVVVGKWIDGAPRLAAGRWALTANNCFVAASGACLVLALWLTTEIQRLSGFLYWALVLGAILLAAASALAGAATKIVVAKDWVTVLADGDKERLAALNSSMVLIDHVCGILSPLLAGQVMTSTNIGGGCLFVAVWNLVSFPIEYALLSRVYRAIPALALPRHASPSRGSLHDIQAPTPASVKAGDEATKPLSQTDMALLPPAIEAAAEEALEKQPRRRNMGGLSGYARGWARYFRHAVFPAALALALLYFTVLGLDGITSSYIVSQGLGANVVGATRALGALSGIGGSLAFPAARSRLGLGWTGILGLGSQVSCLCLCLASLFLPGSPFHWLGGEPMSPSNVTMPTTTVASNATWTPDGGQSETPSHSLISIWVFVLGILLSRFGLWLSDLTITQVMQEGIAERERGIIFGVQSSAQQVFSLLKDLLVIAVPDPQYFGYLVITSCAAITAGLLSFSAYFARHTAAGYS